MTAKPALERVAVPALLVAAVAVKAPETVALAIAPALTTSASPLERSVIESVPASTLNVSLPLPPVIVSLPAPPVRLSFPSPPARLSLPAPPLRALSAPLPMITLSRPLPVPSMAAVPLRVRFSTLARVARENDTEACTVSVPALTSSVIVSVLESTM